MIRHGLGNSELHCLAFTGDTSHTVPRGVFQHSPPVHPTVEYVREFVGNAKIGEVATKY